VSEENLRFGMFRCVLGVLVECPLTVNGRKPLQEREKAGNTDYGAHDIVDVSCFHYHVGPMVSMLLQSLSPKFMNDCRSRPGCSLSLKSQESPNDISPIILKVTHLNF